MANNNKKKKDLELLIVSVGATYNLLRNPQFDLRDYF